MPPVTESDNYGDVGSTNTVADVHDDGVCGRPAEDPHDSDDNAHPELINDACEEPSFLLYGVPQGSS